MSPSTRASFIKGADFYWSAGGEQSARAAFSFATVDEIETGIARLGKLVDSAAVAAWRPELSTPRRAPAAVTGGRATLAAAGPARP